MEPKSTKLSKINMYRNQDSENHRQMKVQNRQKLKSIFEDDDDEVYSSEDSDIDSSTIHQKWVWDKKELQKIQLDEQTIHREYINFWCSNKSDPSNVIKFKVEYSSIKNFMYPEGEERSEYKDYQFIIQNFLIKQDLINSYLKLEMACIRIRKPTDLFDYSYLDKLSSRFLA